MMLVGELRMALDELTSGFTHLPHMGVSENVVYPEIPNGFADHYPYEKWLFHWEYTLFSDKPIFCFF